MDRRRTSWLAIGAMALSLFRVAPVMAIESQPSPEQVHIALEAGKAAAMQGKAPDTFYVRFGAGDELHASGFLITKLGALSVMATHMALRGLQPSDTDVTQVVETKTMLVSTVIFGDVPSFAQESYMVFDQAGRTIRTIRRAGESERRLA